MALMTWWRSDALPALPALRGFSAQRTDDAGRIAGLNRIAAQEADARLRDGHHAYIAALDGQPVGYGWAATRRASIGELGLAFELPRGERYLWDFATLPSYRGLGLYPRLLQAMLRAEASARAWILHAPENLPSGAGIARAGFRPVGRLGFRVDGSVALGEVRDETRAWWGAAIFGVEITAAELSACWCCARGEAACGCWARGRGRAGACGCATAVGGVRRRAA
jgi:GNAT superfamily N-acetyltransferase